MGGAGAGRRAACLELPNTSGLVWIDKSKLLFSEIKDNALHMAIVTAEESRAGSLDLYVPPHERAMAHRSYASPDRKSMLLVEMNERGDFVPCRLLPLDASSPGHQVGPPGAACTFAAWSPNGDWMYFTSNAGRRLPHLAPAFSRWPPEQITSGPTEEEGICDGARRPVVYHSCWSEAKQRLAARQPAIGRSHLKVRLSSRSLPRTGKDSAIACTQELRASCGSPNWIRDAARCCCRALRLQAIATPTTFHPMVGNLLWHRLIKR